MFDSPWLYRLFHRRSVKRLKGEGKAGVVIIGGGISGILTAYYLLTETDRDVVLLEADRMAEGATGHNAGVVTGYIERPVVEMVEEYGKDKTAAGIRELLSGWDLFDALRDRVKPATPIHDTVEKAGYVLDPCLLGVLEDQKALKGTGVAMERVQVAAEAASDPRLEPYRGLFEEVPHERLLSELQTARFDYVGLGRLRAACTNSASLCEDVLAYLVRTFPNRFCAYEHSAVASVSFADGKPILTGKSFRLSAEAMVLCTNGYALDFLRDAEKEITPGILNRLRQYVAYMAGFYEEEAPTSALAYFFADASEWLPYYYLATRPSGEKAAHRRSLFCIGGPERRLAPGEKYHHHDPFPSEFANGIRSFLHEHSTLLSPGARPYHHQWHGLMGYTDNRIRWAGRDRVSPSLYWNLGCNGIGLLPAFVGAKRIARLVNGEKLEPSIFDVPHPDHPKPDA